MRYTGLTTLFAFTFGAFLMATTAEPIDGQEKKDPALKAPFDQFVKVEAVTAKGEKFLKEQVPAHLFTAKTGTKAWWVPEAAIGSGGKELRSIVVTDKDGMKHQCDKAFPQGSGTGRLVFPITTPKS